MTKKVFVGVFKYQLFVTIIALGLASFNSAENRLPLIIGSFISGLNLMTMVLFYVFVFQKKRVALGIFIVVFKYAILGFLLWYFLAISTLPKGAFLAGIILNPLSLVLYTLRNANTFLSKKGSNG